MRERERGGEWGDQIQWDEGGRGERQREGAGCPVNVRGVNCCHISGTKAGCFPGMTH